MPRVVDYALRQVVACERSPGRAPSHLSLTTSFCSACGLSPRCGREEALYRCENRRVVGHRRCAHLCPQAMLRSRKHPVSTTRRQVCLALRSFESMDCFVLMCPFSCALGARKKVLYRVRNGQPTPQGMSACDLPEVLLACASTAFIYI